MDKYWKVYMLAAVSFLIGTSEYMIAGILDKVAADIGVTISAAGQLITAFSLAYAVGTPILMAVTARINRRDLLLYSLAFIVVGNALVVILPGYGFMLLARVIMALGTGVFVVTSLTVAAKLAPPNKQGSAIAIVLMGISASLILGVPLGRIIAASYDWKLIFGGIALLSILGMPIIARSIPRMDGEEPVSLAKQLTMVKKPQIALALGITFFWILGYAIAFTYLSPYLLEVANMSERWVSVALFAYGIASLIGSKAGGFSTDKWGVAKTLTGGMLLNMVMLIVFSAASGTAAFLVFVFLMLWSFFSWSSAPTQQYYLITLSPEASGIMLGLNTSVLQLAMAAGAGIGGVIIEHVSLHAITWIAAASIAVAAATTAVVFGSKRQVKHQVSFAE
ncbi:putative MFS-type transporter YbcL [Paenibacillus glycanilyticus]|uniref:MFS-type transporter YbcL n=1 Tax=Paenibacillus glycanilyticus TaxID=126569 RepID=A0ABQ6NID2_9BACL|nr:MFS transporter [Paenibacillus glycanilyticus]GMK43890.1 putative MFS-type transporter YbcL [Paenibacillus glycanilyticus]